MKEVDMGDRIARLMLRWFKEIEKEINEDETNGNGPPKEILAVTASHLLQHLATLRVEFDALKENYKGKA